MAYKKDEILNLEQISGMTGIPQETLLERLKDFYAGNNDVDIFSFIHVNGEFSAVAEDVERWCDRKRREEEQAEGTVE